MDFNVKEAIEKVASLSEATLHWMGPQPAGTVPLFAVPNGSTLQSVKKLLDEYQDRPDRRVGTDKVQDLKTLIEWTNRHKDAGSVVFCDTTRDKPNLLTIVDYHHEATAEKSGDETARFRAFRALYEFPLSEQWKAWKKVDGVVMDQADFAEFLEDRALDLIAPDIGQDGAGVEIKKLPPQVAQLLGLLGGRCALPQDIITLSKGLSITANARTAQRIDVNTGEGSLMFEEQHVGDGGQKITVPKLFMICIPVFDKAPFHYRIPVRIRYRLSGGIKWIFTLFGADDVIDMAIKEAAEHVREGTEAPLFYGVPA